MSEIVRVGMFCGTIQNAEASGQQSRKTDCGNVD